MDEALLARFPYMHEAHGYVKTQPIPLQEMLSDQAYEPARVMGKQRVLDALERGAVAGNLPQGDVNQFHYLFSYAVARMIVSATGDNYLIRRFALHEAVTGEKSLRSVSDGFLEHLANQIGLELRLSAPIRPRRTSGIEPPTLHDSPQRILRPRTETFRVHFSNYLRHTNTMRDDAWKLVNQDLADGYVYLPRHRVLRLLRNAIQQHIEQDLPLDVSPEILEALKPQLKEVRAVLEVKKATFKAEDIGKVSITRFPPCMYNLLAQIQNHENVPHMGRFAIVAFLHHIGLSNEEIFRVFGDVPDFAADVTRYQIEHITGTSSPTEYTPPECSTMKSYGICPGPDRICMTIKHPLSYYRVKGRERRPRGESASTAV